MSLIVSENEKKFEPVSEGLHLAVCTAVIDIGSVFSEQYQKTQDKVILQWEIIDEKIIIDEQEKNRTISKEFSKSFNEKSNLRKTLKSWRGREFTPEELKAFDLRNVLGVPCQLQISHSANGDKVYANIDSVVSFPKGMDKPQTDQEPFAFDLDSPAWAKDFIKLPEWIQEKIKSSETYKNLTADGKEPSLIEDEEVPF